ncbi:MAG: flagellar biosynthesis protein FlhB [Rhodobacteraceae bacterium]|nr:flagellar biosynthesis protein FlhB [Paracoccaceae bacterium]
MSEGEDNDDKPYDPTPKRLDDARRKGEIPRSTDLLTAASYGGVLLACLAFGGSIAMGLGTALQVMLDQPDRLGRLLLADGGRSQAAGIMGRVTFHLAPIFAIPAGMVLVTLFAQQAFVVTPSKLMPKLSRVSPLSNLKNKFGRNGLFEFAKSFAKLLIISAVLGIYLSGRMGEMIGMVRLEPKMVALNMMRLSLDFLMVVLCIALLIGAVDFLWQRAEHLRRHRMSHKEMMDETKESEGDPHLKQSRRQRGYDIATNRMMADVPKSDVVIVNPEHYAVALKWNRAQRGAPVVVAKGVDEVAARIREAAQLAGVPLHRDPPTARALHATVNIGQEIDRAHYPAVAAAIRFADRMRSKGRR